MDAYIEVNSKGKGAVEAWGKKRIDEVGKVVPGGTPSTAIPEYWDGGVFWVTPTDISNLQSPFIYGTKNTISEQGLLNSSAVLIPVDSLVVCTRATVGVCAINKVPLATNQGFKNIVPFNREDVLYLYYALSSMQEVFHKLAQGSTFLEISKTEFEKIVVSWPPYCERLKIAAILRTWDEAIETAEAELKAKQERKRWLAETVLSGSVRVKGHKTAWDKKRLDQIGKIVPGGTPSTSIPEYWNGDVPWVTPTEITKLKTPYIHITESLITSEGVRNSSAALLPVDSLIVCTRATVGVCAINKVPMTTNQGFKSIVPESTDDTLFLYYVLNSMQSTFNRLAQGSTFLEISKTQFEKMTIIWPEAEERRQIASLMRTADEQTEKIAERIESLRTQKRGLMQKLLTGEVRVAA